MEGLKGTGKALAGMLTCCKYELRSMSQSADIISVELEQQMATSDLPVGDDEIVELDDLVGQGNAYVTYYRTSAALGDGTDHMQWVKP